MGGRRSKAKSGEQERLRQRRKHERAVLAALSGFGDPLVAVHAIVSSPLGMHRHLTLAYAVRLALRTAVQRRPAVRASGGMRELMESLVALAGPAASLEDAVPWDPRVAAVGVFRGRPYRLYPGMLERPLASLRTAELVAQAVDPALRRMVGFGVGDWIEVCLMHTERVVEILAPAWPADGEPEVGDLPVVGTEEMRAAEEVLLWTPLGPEATEEHRKALEWGTIPLGRLEVDLRMMTTCFGTAVAVSGPGGARYALPLPYVTEAWESGIAQLAARAAARSLRSQQEWLRIARGEVGKLLHSLHDLPPADVFQGPAGPVMLIFYGQRHVLALAVAAQIGPGGDVREAETALTAVTPGVSIPTDAGPLTLPEDAEIVRVVVTALIGTSFIGVTEPVAMISLEDLAWIVKTCERSDELWAFFHEQVVTNTDVQMFGWEPVNTWQTWRANGQALHRAGLPPTGIMVAPHQVGDEEWELAGRRAPLEWALHRLGLPPVNQLAVVMSEADPVSFVSADRTAWALGLLDRADPWHGPLFAEVLRGSMPSHLVAFAFDMVGTACRVALQLRDETTAVLRACGLDRLVVEFVYEDASGEPLTLEGGDGGEGGIVIRWTSSLQHHEVENPGYVQRRLGELITTALLRNCGDDQAAAVESLAAAWPTATRVLVVSAETTLNKALDMRRPAPVPEWAVSQANRLLGVHLVDSGQAAGRRDHAESRALELEVILPWLRHQVEEWFARFDASAVLHRAAEEIEAVAFTRDAHRRQRFNRAQMPPRLSETGDPELEPDGESLLVKQSAVLATLMELALVNDQQGTAEPDDIEWAHLLALAGLFVDSTTRADALLHEMSGEVTDVSDRFEITLHAGESTAIDVEAFDDARLRHYQRTTTRPDTELGRGPDLGEILAQVDPAMMTDLGCTATALLGACTVLSAWPVTNEHPTAEVALVDVETELVDQLDIDRAQAQAALAALTLTGADLAAERVQPWKARARDHRLLTRPLIRLTEDTVLVLPWNSAATGRVTSGYLTDGLLPWPTSRLDRCPTVRRAIDQVRLQRTRLLEDQVDERLRDMGFVVRSRIKPHHAHTIGLASLPGEIDHIAMHPDNGVLWVIDDKDLAEVFTPAEIARAVRQFYDPKKGEVGKLQAKVDTVAADCAAVADAFGVPMPTSVQGLFVTRRPSPAAFVPRPLMTFVTLEEFDGLMATG
ncbi:hypothetical protein AB0A74_05185 [Saccharothrix sp. NPDC042600]|uniref:hypothetical protein n=1 Tax=Saccharothrix TaxID=2071 RepID=UPI0033CB1CB9|nr:hypothetical protein GCM10017745_36910 [Saccharothrix mutabilis subsp. capreolus]